MSKNKSRRYIRSFAGDRTDIAIPQIKNGFYVARWRAEIVGLRFHDLRHTVAARLVAAGVNIVDVSKLLGRADIKMTISYAQVSSNSQRRRRLISSAAKSWHQISAKSKMLT